ncbi:MAG: 23S rRNA pseudouridine synthase [Rhodobacteraceae bacterium]|uniref:pseudouridine synthase n=1 Tax=Cypionkella sp. TaxID=2811411 RepID=UPI00132879B0|nr:pseudouridine synthase [Cypionkella sp.]KAF0172323.1 MAG: 23S rRNA pseudouridine synthase [Paracoccaceae bacterium]MDO8327486.1 pseudouridine synthase [Cypionkella sp.]
MAENTSPPKIAGPRQAATPAKPAAAKPTAKTAGTPEGERIAKVLSRAGVASRREAERMIELGEVSVNGKVITSPALNVTPSDKITVRGTLVGAPEQARLWLYYKPDGLVTSESDEKGRPTVFENLPEELPRVMSVGRLDLNSEGLLLLTNDGELKRRLELPSTGWLRKYRVRVNGNPLDPDLEPLRKGIVVDGEKFQPMNVMIDRIQGANAWLTVGLREGKNREIRRAMSAINLTVNRLIRISYGPFRLGDLQPGEVEEVKGKVLRDQLGEGRTPDDEPKRTRAPRPATSRSGASRTTTAKAEGAASGRRLKPGEGMKQLSESWQDATKPRSFGTAAKKAEGARPERPAGKPAAKPAGKPVAKPAGKPAGARPSGPGRPAGGKPAGGRPKRGS